MQKVVLLVVVGFMVCGLFMSVQSKCSNCLIKINGACCRLENQGLCCNYAANNRNDETRSIKGIANDHGKGTLSGCWKEKKAKELSKKYEDLLVKMGVPPATGRMIAQNRQSTVSIKIPFYLKGDTPRVITVVARLLPQKSYGEPVIACNYTNVKPDNKTTYKIPMNQLMEGTNTSKVVFSIKGQILTLYAVHDSEDRRVFSVQWSVSENNSNRMKEKWVHIPTMNEVTFLFDKVMSPNENPYCTKSGSFMMAI